MDVEKLKQTLASVNARTMAAKLRLVMPEIELKVQQGVSHEDIVAALKEGGLEVSLEAFRKTLYRARAKHRTAELRTAAKPAIPQNADGNPSGMGEAWMEEPAAPEQDANASRTVSFDDAIDPRKREALASSYLDRRPPIIGKKRNTQE